MNDSLSNPQSPSAQLYCGNASTLNAKLKERGKYFESVVEKAKEMICLEPTMNGQVKKMCLMGFILFALYSFAIIARVPKPHNEDQKGAVQLIISTTVFGTLLLQYIFHALLSTCTAQETSAVVGGTIACIAGISHSLHLFGTAPKVISFCGQTVSLIQLGEWAVCVPLLVVAIGHILCIDRSVVLYAAASQAFCIIFGLFGSIIQNKVWAWIMLCISEALLLPFLLFIFIFCFKLTHLISPTQPKRIRAIGFCTLTLWNLFPVIYFLGMAGFLSNCEDLLLLCDLFSKALFLAIVLIYQFHDTVAQGTTRLVAMEEASSAQKVFLRFVFHEVRVPFQSLLLGIEHLQQEESLSAFAPMLDVLMSSAEMMKRVIDDVLSLSRLQDGQLKLEPVGFSLEEIVTSTIFGLDKLISDKGVSVIKKIEDSIPSQLYGDPIRLSQILANLVSNAVKFTPPGKSIQVLIQVIDQNEDFSFFCMKVHDQGIGISKKDQKRLFTPYSQINPHQNQEGRGSGLGLSIVKHLVELMGGTISLKSEVGKGSEFSVKLKLPIVKDELVNSREEKLSSEKLSSSFTNMLKLSPRRFPLISPASHSSGRSTAYSSRKKGQRRFSLISPASHSGCSSVNSSRKKFFVSEIMQGEGVHETKGQDYEFQMDIENKLLQEERSPVSHVVSPRSTPVSRKNSKAKIFPSTNHVLPVVHPRCNEEEKTTTRLILVVDDSPSNRKMAAKILKSEGYQVEEAHDGSEAVAMAKKKEFDLILMDNVMPIMNGVEAAREISRLCRNTQIVGLTGNCLEEDVQEFINAGAKEVLIKPCNRKNLIEAVSSILDKKSYH